MTNTTNRREVDPCVCDFRRAAALLTHWTDPSADVSGVNHVLAEVEREQRISECVTALLTIVCGLAPILTTPASRRLQSECVLHMARAEQVECHADPTPE